MPRIFRQDARHAANAIATLLDFGAIRIEDTIACRVRRIFGFAYPHQLIETGAARRIGQPAQKDETFSAVGYGLTQAGGTTSGTRMRIDGNKVVVMEMDGTRIKRYLVQAISPQADG